MKQKYSQQKMHKSIIFDCPQLLTKGNLALHNHLEENPQVGLDHQQGHGALEDHRCHRGDTALGSNIVEHKTSQYNTASLLRFYSQIV